MAALPYMPLYVADYLADAAHLTTLQHGAYLMMLMTYWQRGKPLPADDVQLARIARLSRREWNANRAELRAFFYEEENTLKHRRVETELAKVEAKSLKCKKAGQASAQQRLNERSTSVEQTSNHTDTDTEKKEPLAKANAQTDPEKVMFDQGASYLTSNGIKPDRARSALGKWKRDHGAGAVIEALGAAQRIGAIDPLSFIEGRFRAAVRGQPVVPL